VNTTNRWRRLGALALALVVWIVGWEIATLAAAVMAAPPPTPTLLDLMEQWPPRYWPWQWLVWRDLGTAFGVPEFVGAGAIVLAAVIVIVGRVSTSQKNSTAYGCARWATLEELRTRGFGSEAGVVLCQSEDARYKAITKREEQQWKLKKPGKLICDNSEGHVLVWAPSGSGKLIAFVAPTAYNWRDSAIIYDTKKEIWPLTAGWRSQWTRCLRFEPADRTSIRFNPLFQIPRDERDVAEAQNIATMICQTHSERNRDGQHWKLTATDLVSGAILHVLYAGARKSLPGVRQLLAGDGQTQIEVLMRMAATPHLGDRPHPQILAYATAGLNMAPNERSGVFSTAISHLGLFLDPIVAANVDDSDFAIDQLVHLPEPVSLYLVVSPRDEARMRPLVRLMLEQIGRTLMGVVPPRQRTPRRSVSSRLLRALAPNHAASDASLPLQRRRLLYLIDEFPSLGHLEFFGTMLAASRGYGIKLALVAQSLNQLEEVYGRSHSIVDNAHTQLTFYARSNNTAKYISDMLGQRTARETRLSRSRRAGGLFFNSVSESDHEHGMPLLASDEVLRFPFDSVLLSIAGSHPYRGKKIMHYLDQRFCHRALPPPDSAEAQRAELPPKPAHGWDTPPIEPANDALELLRLRFGIQAFGAPGQVPPRAAQVVAMRDEHEPPPGDGVDGWMSDEGYEADEAGSAGSEHSEEAIL
jgi:type IV secretion system protein VirD4